MRRSACIFILALIFSAASLPAAGPALSLKVVPDRGDYLYSLGDSVTFRVSLQNAGPDARLHYGYSEDHTRFLDEGDIDHPGREITLRHGMQRPGFLRLDLTLVSGTDTARTATAVGFSLGAIRPTNQMPEDWRLFWQQGLGEIYRVPIDPQVSLWKDQEPGIKRYQVSLANVEGSRMYAWLSVPDGPGPFPALVYIQGAPGGIGEYNTDPQADYARHGMIVLAINPHGIELGREESFYRGLMARGIPGSAANQGADDPYRYYFRRVVLGAVRGFDYLCSRPDVDSSRLGVSGASQGGGLSLLTAAVDRRVRAVTVHVPAMCDYTGVLHERPTGWPHILDHRTDDPRVLRTTGYFDAALAASQIRATAFFTVSFLDESCPPTTVYSAYNSLKGPKEIKHTLNTTHPGSFTPDNDSLMVAKLGAMFEQMKAR